MEKTQKRYAVKVVWSSPYGKPAPSDRCLSLTEEVWKDAGYVEYRNPTTHSMVCHESFIFLELREAKEFKRRVDEFYSEHPQYFVINDECQPVIEDGNPIVAWQPELTIEGI
jgi:hypothetical protein